VLSDFQRFVLRGNVVDLAVAVVLGTAFTAVVNAVVVGLLTPLVAAVVGEPSFGDLGFTVNGSRLVYGAVLDALIAFVLVAAVLFFLVVRPVNALSARLRPEPPLDAETRDCPECLSAVPRAARRCAFCTAALPAAQ
jgi:large conductance mechanosensitive channel